MGRGYETGDVVAVKVRGGGVVDAVVARSRRFKRGRNAGRIEYTLAPLDFGRNGGKPYYITAHEQHVGPTSGRYSEEQVRAAMGVQAGVEERREENRAKRSDRNYADGVDAERKFGRIEPGDEVLIAYTDGSRWETVGAVSAEKVGIVRRGVERIRAHNRERELTNYALSEIVGRTIRQGIRRELRWIEYRFVKEVRKAEPERKAASR